MLIGAHISAAGGVNNAPVNAHKLGCECYQFFSRSPRGGQAPELTPEIINEFKQNNKKYNLKNYYIHSPYYINLASEKNNIYHGSIEVLREELERGSQLDAGGMMFHIGSSKDLGQKEAIKKVVAGLKEILKGYSGSCQPLLEISAGAGNIIGDTFEEIAEIINKVENNKLGVCFDTAHAFESGYDLRDKKTVKKIFDEFDKIIGLKRLKLIHINDSKTDFGSHHDRHEHIGQGKIGVEGFRAIINEPRLKNINLILETPTDTGIVKDMKLLKKLHG